MTWFLQTGSLDRTTLRQRCDQGTVRPTEFVEALYERGVRCAVPSILTSAALLRPLQGVPQGAGSTA
jgi:hypothetical protein